MRPLEAILKTATYPILGNLSQKVQEKIEEIAPWYNGVAATKVTAYVVNPILWGVAGYLLQGEYNLVSERIPFGERQQAVAGVFACLNVLAGQIRLMGGAGHSHADFGCKRSVGSILGKIISLPIEKYIDSHDCYKNKV